MTALREAVVIPLLFLTSILMAATDVGPRVTVGPPSLFSLVLATLLVGTLVRCGAVAPARLLHTDRAMLANANGFVVVATLFDVATLGTVSQPPRPAIAGYMAFLTVVLFLAGVSLLPRPLP